MDLEGSEVSPAKKKKAEVTGLMDDVEDYKKEFDHEFIANLISQYFSLKLMEKVEKFHMRRKQNQEAVPFEASDTDEEYSDEDALAA